MLTKNENVQAEIVMCTMEQIVPQNSIFRKIAKYIDFSFIYDKVKDLYCENNGRPSIDPVVLFKLVFIQAIDGIKSMRKTCEKIKVDAEYRWFLDIPFGYDTPNYSTFSQNYIRRFADTSIFEDIFVNIVEQAIEYKLVDGGVFFTDSTHKKANANKNKYHEEIVESVKKRNIELENEINEQRKIDGKKEFKYEDKTESKKIKVSDTDSESGYYHRDNKEKGFMYLDHRTVDIKNNIIVDCYVTKGNVHDSQPFIYRAEYIKEKFGFKAEEWALDSGYNTLEIKKYLIENNIFGVIGYRRYNTEKTSVKKYEFKYKKDSDLYICPRTGVTLEYTGIIDRNGYKKYANKQNCKDCPHVDTCCKNKGYREIRRHIYEEYNEIFRENRLSQHGKDLYKYRKETVERSFADSKNNHGYRYAMYRGLEKNQNYTWLICAAQNMKIIANRNSKKRIPPLKGGSYTEKSIIFSLIFFKIVFYLKFVYKMTNPTFQKAGLSTN